MKKELNYIVLVTVCLVSLGIAVTSCQSQAGSVATNPPMPAASPTVEPTPSGDEIRDTITNALLALNTQSNRMDVITIPADGNTQTSTIEFVPPDRKHIVDLNSGVEYIVIGQKVYMKTGASGNWEETQIPASTFLGEGEVSGQTIGETISDVQLVRDDTLDGRAVRVYSYNSTTTASGVELHSQTELWVGVSDGLPYKMVINGEVLSASTDPTSGESKIKAAQAQTSMLITFDPAISIESPIP
jgi:hypothetical protein